MILADEDATGEVLWAATDHLGSVTHLLDFDGTSDTDVVATFTYDAFGKVVDQTGTGVQFIYGWTGREVDAESDEQNNRARYYDADIGRWLSQDPISFAAGDENLYRYVENSPTIYTDPSGLEPGWIDWLDAWHPGGNGQYDHHYTWSWHFSGWTSEPAPTSSGSNIPAAPKATGAEVTSNIAKDDKAFAAQNEIAKKQYKEVKDNMEDLGDHLGSGTPIAGQFKDGFEIGRGRRYIDEEELDCWDYAGRGVNVGAAGITILGSADELVEFGGSAGKNAGKGKSTFRHHGDEIGDTASDFGPARPRGGGGGAVRGPTRFIENATVVDRRTGRTFTGTVDVGPTLDRIKSGGTFPHRNDGGVFRNRPLPGKSTPELPVRPEGYYHEYVHPTPGINGPGPQRIVVGRGGEMYYTCDHYTTFVPLNP